MDKRMDNRSRRYAPLGLWLFAVGAVVSIGLAIVTRQWALPLQLSIGLSIVGLALFVALDPDRVRVALTGRQAKHGANAIVLVIAFVGILVIINYLVYRLSAQFPEQTRWDLTSNLANTLAPETIQTLSQLSEPVKAQAFYTNPAAASSVETLLTRFAENSKGRFSFEVLNPNEKPLAATEAEITAENGQLVVWMGERKQLVKSITEQELTSALIRLISKEKRAIYFLIGHGEFNPEETGDTSYGSAKSTLEGKNYSVATLNLQATGAIPDDAHTIVIAGPVVPVSVEEVDLLASFLAGGGSLIVLEDPTPETQFGETPDPLAGYLSQSWGITLTNDIVVHVEANTPSPVAVGNQFGDHPITQKITSSAPTFPGVRSVRSTPLEGVTQVNLILTTPYLQNCFPYCSWTTNDLPGVVAWLKKETSAPPLPTNDKTMLGPIPVAVAAENTAGGGRVVVVGDSGFAMNLFIQANFGNSDLFINSVDWAAGQEELINLTPKPVKDRYLSVPPESTELVIGLLLFGSMFVLPGAVVAAGVIAWAGRRKRG